MVVEMFLEGSEYSIEDLKSWEGMILSRGEIIEVHLPSCPNLQVHGPPDIWAGFWIKQVLILGTGDYACIVKSLGCSHQDWVKYFSAQFNRRLGKIHLCTEKDCAIEDEFALHVTRLRVFSVEGFDRHYMNSYVKRQINKWDQDELDDLDTSVLDVSGVPRRDDPAEPGLDGVPLDERTMAPPAPERKARLAPAADVDKDKKKEKPEKLGAEERARLRERLEAARAKMVNAKIAQAGNGTKTDEREEEVASKRSSSPGYSPSEGFEGEVAGLELPALPDRKQQDQRKVVKHKEKSLRKRKASEENHGESSSEVKKRKKKKKSQEVATRDSTTTSWQTQLVLKAKENAEAKKEKAREEKKKRQKKNPGYQLAKMLTSLTSGRPRQQDREDGWDLTPYGKKEKNKKDKKKRQRRKKKEGGDPGSSPGSSPSGNSGSSFDGESGEESSGSEAKKLEAPLKRKSKERPGSVLAMLLDHARSKLDQSAKVSVDPSGQGSMTKGVKMSSYFAIVVRSQIGNSMAQARELHHLAQVIDLLRQGDLDVMGDVLAARFISIHQSVIDGSWATARHLEMMPLEEGTAAGPEIILNARKQARLAAKLSPGDNWSWAQGAKGRGGGRGRGNSWQDYGQEAKGKGKKGNKGKGKSKGWQAQEKDADSKTREKVPEK